MQHRPENGQFLAKLPDDLNDTAVLQRIADGVRVSTIAHELGVSPSALYQRYRGHPGYLPARLLGTAARLDCAEREVEVADDPLTLARAREVHRTVAWRASVEHPSEWGQHQHITVEHIGDLGEKLRRARERVIEGECVAITASCAAASPDSPTVGTE